MSADNKQTCLTLLAVAIVLAGGLMLWWPAQRDVSALEKEIVAMQQSLLGAQGRTEGLTELAVDVQRMRREIADTRKTIPQHDELSDVLRALSTRMTTLNLTDQSMTSRETSPSDNYFTLPLEITFAGHSQDAFRFVNSLERMSHLARITRLRLASREDAGTVKASLRVDTYFYLPEGRR